MSFASRQLVTKTVGAERNQHLHIISHISCTSRKKDRAWLMLVEWMNESWIHLPIPPTLPYFTRRETTVQRDQVAYHYKQWLVRVESGSELSIQV